MLNMSYQFSIQKFRAAYDHLPADKARPGPVTARGRGIGGRPSGRDGRWSGRGDRWSGRDGRAHHRRLIGVISGWLP